MSMSTFQKVTLATCLVLCVALLLPKMLLSRGKKDAAQTEGSPGRFPPMVHRQMAPDSQGQRAAGSQSSRAHNTEAMARAKGGGGTGAGTGGKSNLAGQIIPIYGFGILMYILYILFKITSKGNTKPAEPRFPSVRAENQKRKITDFELSQLQEKLKETEDVMEKIVNKANHSPERVQGVDADQEEALLLQLREITRVMQEGHLVEGVAQQKKTQDWEGFPEDSRQSWDEEKPVCRCHHHPQQGHPEGVEGTVQEERIASQKECRVSQEDQAGKDDSGEAEEIGGVKEVEGAEEIGGAGEEEEAKEEGGTKEVEGAMAQDNAEVDTEGNEEDNVSIREKLPGLDIENDEFRMDEIEDEEGEVSGDEVGEEEVWAWREEVSWGDVEVMEEGETARGDVVEQEETTREEVGEEGETMRDEVGEEGETARDEGVNGEVTRDDVGEEGETTREEVGEEEETNRDEVGKEGETTREEVEEEGETASDDVVEEGEIRDEIVEAEVVYDEVGEKGSVSRGVVMTEDVEAGSDEIVDLLEEATRDRVEEEGETMREYEDGGGVSRDEIRESLRSNEVREKIRSDGVEEEGKVCREIVEEVRTEEGRDKVSRVEVRDESSRFEVRDEISRVEVEDDISRVEVRGEISRVEVEDNIARKDAQETNEDVAEEADVKGDAGLSDGGVHNVNDTEVGVAKKQLSVEADEGDGAKVEEQTEKPSTMQSQEKGVFDHQREKLPSRNRVRRRHKKKRTA